MLISAWFMTSRLGDVMLQTKYRVVQKVSPSRN